MGKIQNFFSWRLFFSALGIVFLSEMGDKTQISTMLLAGAKPAYVFWVGLGSAMALVCTSFVEVIIGSQLIARFIKPNTIKVFSGITFLTLGLLLVFGVMGNVNLEM